MATDISAGSKVMARHDRLMTFCTQVLLKLAVPLDEAEMTAGSLVTANLRGVDTHGVLRLPLYAARLKRGAMTPSATLTTEKETIATALLDGHNGIGQVISCKAMEIAIRKAREAGVSYVAVKHSNHFGAAAYYPMMALDHDMIGIAMTNASPRLVPTGGVERLLGNNPFCVAVPAGKRPPVVLDMANSIVAGGKIRVLQKEGKPIPEGWALNADGEPTTDPAAAMKGILLAIALSAFTDVAAFKARMDAYIDEIKSSKKAKGSEVIYVAGEPEVIKMQERLEKGIPLQAKVAEELSALGKDLGVPAEF
jgi:LDH2 family malate/lactate/ureidoglycolate dehydrogenase